MDGLGLCILEEGIQAMIQENLDEQTPKERIIAKLQKYFGLTEEYSEHYYKKFAETQI